MPDISSFLVTAKNQEDLDSGKQSKKRTKNGKRVKVDEDYEEVMPTMGSSSRRRRGAAAADTGSGNCSDKGLTVAAKEERAYHDSEGVYILPEHKQVKISYPNKKYQVSTLTTFKLVALIYVFVL